MSNKVKLRRQLETRTSEKKIQSKKGSKKTNIILLGVAIFLIAGFLFTQNDSNRSADSPADKTKGASKAPTYEKLDGDLKIVKSEVTSEVKVYSFKLADTNMEVLALKADDGTIRTALNTCQVCYNSGKGYYVQDQATKELVCQNCGNRFAPANVEIVKGGCNPIPIMKDNKTEDNTNITISQELLKEASPLFTRWSKN